MFFYAHCPWVHCTEYICLSFLDVFVMYNVNLEVQDRSNMGGQMKSRAEASMRRIVDRVTTSQLFSLHNATMVQHHNCKVSTMLHLVFR